jgi:hypothetical protein
VPASHGPNVALPAKNRIFAPFIGSWDLHPLEPPLWQFTPAHQSTQLVSFGLAELDPISFIPKALLGGRAVGESTMNQLLDLPIVGVD